MADHCSPTFDQLAHSMGFSCRTAGGLVEFRNPFGLENWTLPVLEATIILGAVLTLIYAIVRLRRHGDPTNLVLWVGALFFLFIIEPAIYFPATFRTEEYLGTMFAHNVFSVDFLWGRLPLYIIAIYPFMATIAYELVRMLGVFRRHGTFVGAMCVGFVHHAFYEIFDQIGPQLRWWEWDTGNKVNQPMFNAVPLPSVVVFAALWPMSLTLCVRWFVGRQVDAGRRFGAWQLVWRTVVVGLAAAVGTFVLPLPATVFGAWSDTVRGVLYAAELVAIAVVAIPVLARGWSAQRTEGRAVRSNALVRWYALAYLVVFGVLWASALPDYPDAVHGRTASGTPIGSVWYTLACFVVGGLVVAGAFTVPRTETDSAAESPADRQAATEPV
ncbi:hypothetical protein G4X40_16250 [Rhodococcus sp. D2-41]|uniref:hypothetical protein n=1 Tax=Speluncibacter jeojiensis TaxID=2710754 RepID=UPI0024109414|nr:hypothetical protein [Rhodococcus sp. D2-41]MDG3011697.1 hypothetical protein [Rhodococcus sp. D2-41]